jgi:hypothetical protein
MLKLKGNIRDYVIHEQADTSAYKFFNRLLCRLEEEISGAALDRADERATMSNVATQLLSFASSIQAKLVEGPNTKRNRESRERAKTRKKFARDSAPDSAPVS